MPLAMATSGTGAIQVDVAGTNLTLNGAISGSGALTKTGPGTLTINAAYSVTGATTLDGGGKLTFAAANANVKAIQFGTVQTNPTSPTNFSNLDINDNVAATSLLAQNNSAVADTITIAGGKTLTVNGSVTLGYNIGSATNTGSTLVTITGGSLIAGGAARFSMSASKTPIPMPPIRSTSPGSPGRAAFSSPAPPAPAKSAWPETG